MNTIYIVFIVIIAISFILGLFVTFFKAKYEMKLHKYNNSALRKDNYEYAKEYAYDICEFNYSDEIKQQDIQNNIECKINDNINENTIVIPILEEEDKEQISPNNTEYVINPIIYAIMDDEIL